MHQVNLNAIRFIHERQFKWEEKDIKTMGPAHLFAQDEEGIYHFLPLTNVKFVVQRALDPRYTEIWKHLNQTEE